MLNSGPANYRKLPGCSTEPRQRDWKCSSTLSGGQSDFKKCSVIVGWRTPRWPCALECSKEAGGLFGVGATTWDESKIGRFFCWLNSVKRLWSTQQHMVQSECDAAILSGNNTMLFCFRSLQSCQSCVETGRASLANVGTSSRREGRICSWDLIW